MKRACRFTSINRKPSIDFHPKLENPKIDLKSAKTISSKIDQIKPSIYSILTSGRREDSPSLIHTQTTQRLGVARKIASHTQTLAFFREEKMRRDTGKPFFPPPLRGIFHQLNN